MISTPCIFLMMNVLKDSLLHHIYLTLPLTLNLRLILVIIAKVDNNTNLHIV